MCGFGSFDDFGLGFMVRKDKDLRGLRCLAGTQKTDLLGSVMVFVVFRVHI
jgi:hypothetical protein